MKRFFITFNFFLIFMIVGIIFMRPSKMRFSSSVVPKSITTNLFYGIESDEIQVSSFEESNKLSDAVYTLKKEMFYQTAGASVVSDVLETQVGTMSAYGLDCFGCSGRVGSGYPALENQLVYNDPKYGILRIVAGDKKYPYGTVVRVVDSKIGTFHVIVLDRGGDIGIGRRYLFDLLFSTEAEASQFGLARNTTFEVLRYGY